MREVCETLDPGKIEAQTRCPNLHSQSRFSLRLSSELRIRAGARPSINLARNAELFVDSEDAGQAVGDHIVLREQFCRRSKDRDAKIAEGVEAAVASKLLADQN